MTLGSPLLFTLRLLLPPQLPLLVRLGPLLTLAQTLLVPVCGQRSSRLMTSLGRQSPRLPLARLALSPRLLSPRLLAGRLLAHRRRVSGETDVQQHVCTSTVYVYIMDRYRLETAINMTHSTPAYAQIYCLTSFNKFKVTC